MALPTLTIPNIPLPFEIHAMMHPAIVHFAVALPVVILLIEIINLGARRKSIGAISFVFILLMAVVYLGAYLTGTVDANNAKDAIDPQTKELLEAHKNGGIWMVYSAIAILVIKLISTVVNKFPARVVFLVILGLFFWGATGVVQKGCALTYKHGVNVKVSTTKAADTIKENVVNDVDKKAEEVKEEAAKVVEDVKAKTEQAAHKTIETVKQKASEAVEKTKEVAEKAVKSVKEKTGEATEAAKKAVESTKEKADEAKKALEKIIEPAPKTAPEPAPKPVETVPAG